MSYFVLLFGGLSSHIPLIEHAYKMIYTVLSSSFLSSGLFACCTQYLLSLLGNDLSVVWSYKAGNGYIINGSGHIAYETDHGTYHICTKRQ